MKRIAPFLGLLLLALPARAQYLDGLPPAVSVSSSDIIPICQGGTAGHAGTCTTRKATASQLQLGSLTNMSIDLGTGTLTAAGATINGALTASSINFSGPLHMGTNLIDGSNAGFTGGTLTGLTYAGGAFSGTFTGSPTFSGTPVFANGGSLAGTFSGTPTFSGAVAASSTLSVGGALTTSTGSANGFSLSGSTLSVTGSGNPVTIIRGLGSGQLSFQTGATPFTSFAVLDGGASEVNSIRITPGTTGNGVSIQALGDAAAVLNLKAGTSGTAGSVKSFAGMNVAAGLSYGANTTYVSGTGIGPIPSTNQAQLWNNVTLSGTVDTGIGTPYFWQVADHISAPSGMYMFELNENMGAGSDGGRIGYGLTFSKTVAAATVATNYAYAGATFFMHNDHGDGGNSTTPLGGFTNINPDIRCNTSDWISGCITDEHDLRLYAGTNAPIKINQVLHYGISDAVHASGTVGAPLNFIDADLVLDASPTIGNGTGKGLVAIGFGTPAQDVPWDAAASIGSALMGIFMNQSGNMSGIGQAYIDDGFRLPELFVRGKFIDNGAFYVSGAGDITSGNATLAAVSTGQSLSVSGVVEVSAVIVGGGTGAKVGAEIVDSIGGVWQVATISGAAVATVTLKRGGSAASCPASPTTTRMFNAITPPTLNITCANRLGLTVQNSSGTLGFYGATPIAKPTGWTAMTGTPDTGTVYDTSTVTLPQLAGRVASLQAALTAAGLIGP